MLEPAAITIVLTTVILLLLVIWKPTRKLVIGVVFAALLIFAAINLQNAARADELPEEFYYKVVFIDDVEELPEETIIHSDDLRCLWDYFEDDEDIDFCSNSFLNDIAKAYLKENMLWYAEQKTEPITKGRIVVLTMWECTEDPFDDEVVASYYSKYITNTK